MVLTETRRARFDETDNCFFCSFFFIFFTATSPIMCFDRTCYDSILRARPISRLVQPLEMVDLLATRGLVEFRF